MKEGNFCDTPNSPSLALLGSPQLRRRGPQPIRHARRGGHPEKLE